MTDLQKQLKQLAEKNKFNKIISIIEKVSEDKQDWETISYYIRALNNTGQYDRAIEMSVQYQEQCANDAYWCYLLGYSYYALDRSKEAKEVLLRGKGLAKSGTAVLSNIDELLLELGKVPEKAKTTEYMTSYTEKFKLELGKVSEEAKTTEHMMSYIEKFKLETAIPSIVLTTELSNDIAITSSKFGGIPYLPKDYVYPATVKGEPLKLLAQLNFAELPKLDNFPASGILQFFVLPDDSIGLQEWPNLTVKQDTYRVVYHKEVLPEDAQMKDFPEIELANSEDGWFPFEGEYLVKGNIANCTMTFSTHEFNEAFASFCKKNNIESHFEPCFADFQKMQKNMTKSEFNKWERMRRNVQNMVWSAFGDDESHRISGYPFFTQGDPRAYGKQKKYDTLLFQMASEYNNEKPNHEIMWGDAGVANFFISLEDLKNLNFQNVIYTWDCA